MSIRYYQPDDFKWIKEISSHIWDGQDYLPRKINQFHKDPNSHPLVVELDERIVSVGNMRFIRDDLVWLEAIRTHPDARGKGYARSISVRHLEIARELGAREAWLSTSKDNKATGKLLQRIGFEEIYLITLWQEDAESTTSTDPDGRLLRIQDLDHLRSDKALDWSNRWKLCQSPEKLMKISRSIINNSYHLLLGEFKALPPDSYESQDWIKSGSVYTMDNPPSVLTMNSSSERDNLLVIGVTTNSADTVEAALLFTQRKYPDTKLKIFYSATVDNTLFESDWKMRIMRYLF